jgi:putative transposase
MLKAYKYRIYPDADQRSALANIFGQVRFVYNLGLETKISAYAANQTNVTCFDLNKQITELKNECDWLKQCSAQALQMAMRNLDNAYHAFFRGAGFPKFKSKHDKQSFQLPQGVRISDDNKQVFIPKLKWVDMDTHRGYKGTVKTVTISKTTTDKYFISLLVDTGSEAPVKQPVLKSTTVGIDLGIKDFVITSEGKKFDNKDFFKSQMRKLRVAQRSLARKQKGSKNYEEQKKIVALLHEKIKNQRTDYLHKISTYLVSNYDSICIEDLAVSNMVKNHNLARAISDMGWGNFKSMLTYKCDWYGKNLFMLNRFEPSSKTCSCCGKINKELTLKDRVWTCTKCNTTHDRDVNAATNIKTFGLRNKPVMPEREALACAWHEEAHNL